ncbi:hypothetical protein OTK49_02825 [Vibrio coralliirubri]|uniref:hypothetical protein n=1 Tax=Vibrio coralliirubri TaxID=1516159 RepID=UPI00228498F4|nr:hypothetical protein [Vibrio coralliirubri]MCY9861452.1 hypothetical protein [Vibrio coralliirubri]
MSFENIKFTKVSFAVQVLTLLALGLITYNTTDIEYKKLLFITFVVFGLAQIVCGEKVICKICKVVNIDMPRFEYKKSLFVISEVASFFIGISLVLCAAAYLHSPKLIASQSKDEIDDLKCAVSLINNQVECPSELPVSQPLTTDPQSGSQETHEIKTERNALTSLIAYFDKAFIDNPPYGVFGFAIIFWIFTRFSAYLLYALLTKNLNPLSFKFF